MIKPGQIVRYRDGSIGVVLEPTPEYNPRIDWFLDAKVSRFIGTANLKNIVVVGEIDHEAQA